MAQWTEQTPGVYEMVFPFGVVTATALGAARVKHITGHQLLGVRIGCGAATGSSPTLSCDLKKNGTTLG